MKYHGDIDTQLMLLVKQGDQDAMGELYQRNISNVKRYFAQVGKVNGRSEDFSHDVFTCIWRNREFFRAESTFKTFMYSISKIVLINHLRSLKRGTEIFKNIGVLHEKTELSQPEAAFFFTELLKNIEINLTKLTKKQRQTIELILDSDLTPEAAAKKAHCSDNTLRKRKTDARNRLKKLINFSEII